MIEDAILGFFRVLQENSWVKHRRKRQERERWRWNKNSASCSKSGKMEVKNNHETEQRRQDAIKDYILNRALLKIKSFMYGEVSWVEGEEEPSIEIEVRGRANIRPECSGCGGRGPGYDRLPERRFEFIPFWGIKVFFLYAPWCRMGQTT